VPVIVFVYVRLLQQTCCMKRREYVGNVANKAMACLCYLCYRRLEHDRYHVIRTSHSVKLFVLYFSQCYVTFYDTSYVSLSLYHYQVSQSRFEYSASPLFYFVFKLSLIDVSFVFYMIALSVSCNLPIVLPDQ